ncbi:MAG TPA: aldehyde dehydrogenase family protein [Candidatus Brocadiia bacterium]|nr:aldehyde dehydrogenase family protein [Candidatus Brocadiia bacterium]
MGLQQVVTENGKKFLKLINPATGKPIQLEGREILTVRVCGADDVAQAVDNAHEAAKQWPRMTHGQRTRIFREAEGILADNARRVATVVTQETGKPIAESMSEVYGILEGMRYFPKQAKRLAGGRWRLPSNLINKGKPLKIFHKPKGVVGYIMPWNYPFAILVPIVQSLAAGNCVVLKPSSETPLTGLELYNVFSEAWKRHASGPCPLQVITGSHSVTGVALLEELARGRIKDISLTGSVDSGVDLSEKLAPHLKQPVLELGGKDPVIVCDDADIDLAARASIFASFYNCGQTCCSVERVYVTRKSADAFIKRVVEIVSTMKVGNGMDETVDMGPVINRSQLEKVKSHVDEAVERGAKVLFGGKVLDQGEYAGGTFFQPTVLTDVNHEMMAMREETFGPTLPIMVVDSESEAVKLANDSEYGLNGAVFTKDISKGIRIAQQIESGVVYVNDVLWSFTDPSVPWIGIKKSGCGASQGDLGFLHCTTPQVMLVNASKKWLPLDMRQPWLQKSGSGLLSFFTNAIQFQHGRSGRLGAMMRTNAFILKNFFK